MDAQAAWDAEDIRRAVRKLAEADTAIKALEAEQRQIRAKLRAIPRKLAEARFRRVDALRAVRRAAGLPPDDDV